MKKFAVQYVRIEHQVYFLEVEAENENDAEDVACEEFTGSENYKVVHAEYQEFQAMNIDEALHELRKEHPNAEILNTFIHTMCMEDV